MTWRKCAPPALLPNFQRIVSFTWQIQRMSCIRWFHYSYFVGAFWFLGSTKKWSNLICLPLNIFFLRSHDLILKRLSSPFMCPSLCGFSRIKGLQFRIGETSGLTLCPKRYNWPMNYILIQLVNYHCVTRSYFFSPISSSGCSIFCQLTTTFILLRS